MEGFKGTPGPWGRDQFGNIVHCPADGWGRKEGVRVSGVALPGRVTEEYEANTKLVAAAPELLEALQNLKRELVLSDVDLAYIESHFRPHIDRARAAIAKALGQ